MVALLVAPVLNVVCVSRPLRRLVFIVLILNGSMPDKRSKLAPRYFTFAFVIGRL